MRYGMSKKEMNRLYIEFTAEEHKRLYEKTQRSLDEARGHKDTLPKLTSQKDRNLYISKLAKECGLTGRAKRLATCSQHIRFITDGSGKHKVCVQRYACHDRFCPICQMILARQHARVLSAILRYLMKQTTKAGNPKYTFAFITPTTPDVYPIYKDHGKKLDSIATGEEYRAEVDIQNASVTRFLESEALDGFHKIYKRNNKGQHWLKKCNGRILGAVIKVEATLKRNLALNAHDHVLVALHGSYFGSRYYLPKDKWIQLWNESVLSVCKDCMNPNRHDKNMNNAWHKVVASNIYRYIGASLDKGKHGLNISVEPLYYKKAVTWLNGNKSFKKVRLTKKNANKVAPHVAKEVSKYETKQQDFASLAKHGVPHESVVSIFKSMTMAYRGVHGLKYFGLLKKTLKKYKGGGLDKYTNAYQNNVLYENNMFSKFHNAKAKFKRYYSSKFTPLTDYQKIEVRTKLHLPTTYTTAEKHNHFHSKHDEHIKDLITGKYSRKLHESRLVKESDELEVLKSYWKVAVIKKYFNFLVDKYDTLGDTEYSTQDAYQRLQKGLKQSNIQKWINSPEPSQWHSFVNDLREDFNGKLPTQKDQIKFYDDPFGQKECMTMVKANGVIREAKAGNMSKVHKIVANG